MLNFKRLNIFDMARMALSLLLVIVTFSCKPIKKENKEQNTEPNNTDFVIAFGSCNNQNLPNPFWNEILNNKPDIWIWGGDIIYADTENMQLMNSYYNQVKNDSTYSKFVSNVEILGTWDDHDYGLNDGGEEFTKKDSAQQLLLDFLDVPLTDMRRQRKGIYHSKNFVLNDKTIKIILLDTRYFRTGLLKDPSGEKRYLPDTTNHGTILGNEQWQWLTKELSQSKAEFNIIMSSIQFLSKEHGFETWGNMPYEVQKLNDLIVKSKAKNVILLSGDRHISEISSTKLPGLSYPLIDFTSSGMTHSYTSYTSEPNMYRISEVIKDKSFGILRINVTTNTVMMEIRGIGNELLVKYEQQY